MRDADYKFRMSIVSLCLLIIGETDLFSSHAASNRRAARAFFQQQRESRLATPPTLKCPRDNTTSFTGRIVAYRRTSDRMFIRVRTDEETTEEFVLRYGKSDPARRFLINGRPFAQRDWRRIESRAGRLRSNTRATVWACYIGDGLSAELIDWRLRE